MKPHPPSHVTPPKRAPEGPGADALLAQLAHLAKEQELEDEPASYASPPCYLAEFSDAGLADHPAK